MNAIIHSALRGTVAIAVIVLAAIATPAHSQSLGTVKNDSLHPSTYDFSKSWFNNMFFGRHTFTKASTTGDTLVIPGLENGDLILAFRKTLPTHNGSRTNELYFRYATAASLRDSVIFGPSLVGDTLTVDFIIIRKKSR